MKKLYCTWKGHYRKFQVPIMIFNEKALVNISCISNLNNAPCNLLSFVLKIAVNECLKNSMRNYFSFAFDFEQEMPSRQPKSAKKGSERYLMLGPNHILRWDDGCSPGHEKACRWFLYKYNYWLRQN